MNNSESARKLNQAVNNTSKAVGGAISQAKEAFSSFWSTFSAPNAATPAPANFEAHMKSDTFDAEPKEVTEAREGVIKQIAKKLHNNDLGLKQQKETGPNQEGIVEIGREVNTLDSERKNNIVNI